MSYSLVRVSAAVSPVSLQQLKHHLRIELEETYEDEYLQDLIADAVEYVEHQADITIPQTIWRLSFPVVQSTQVIHLPRPPIVNVTLFEYIDPENAIQSFSDFVVDSDSGYLQPSTSWPASASRTNAYQITYEAGSDIVDPKARRAILLVAGHWYKNRESATEKNQIEMPHAVDRLIEDTATR